MLCVAVPVAVAVCGACVGGAWSLLVGVAIGEQTPPKAVAVCGACVGGAWSLLLYLLPVPLACSACLSPVSVCRLLLSPVVLLFLSPVPVACGRACSACLSPVSVCRLLDVPSACRLCLSVPVRLCCLSVVTSVSGFRPISARAPVARFSALRKPANKPCELESLSPTPLCAKKNPKQKNLEFWTNQV